MSDPHLLSVPAITPGCDCEVCKATAILRQELTRAMKLVCSQCDVNANEFRAMLLSTATGELIASGGTKADVGQIVMEGLAAQVVFAKYSNRKLN